MQGWKGGKSVRQTLLMTDLCFARLGNQKGNGKKTI